MLFYIENKKWEQNETIMEKLITRTCENILGIFNACFALLCFVEVDTHRKQEKKRRNKRNKEMSGKLEIENRAPID